MNVEQENSRASESQPTEIYETSQYSADAWGQPPVSLWAFTVTGNVLHGQLTGGPYVHTIVVPPAAPPEPRLGDELQAWDKLSDEALLGFERQLEQ